MQAIILLLILLSINHVVQASSKGSKRVHLNSKQACLFALDDIVEIPELLEAAVYSQNELGTTLELHQLTNEDLSSALQLLNRSDFTGIEVKSDEFYAFEFIAFINGKYYKLTYQIDPKLSFLKRTEVKKLTQIEKVDDKKQVRLFLENMYKKLRLKSIASGNNGNDINMQLDKNKELNLQSFFITFNQNSVFYQQKLYIHPATLLQIRHFLSLSNKDIRRAFELYEDKNLSQQPLLLYSEGHSGREGSYWYVTDINGIAYKIILSEERVDLVKGIHRQIINILPANEDSINRFLYTFDLIEELGEVSP